MTNTAVGLFVGIVFLTVLVASQIIVISSFGSTQDNRNKLRKRLEDILHGKGDEAISIVKLKNYSKLEPVERFLEDLPGIKQLKVLFEQSGKPKLAYRFVLMLLFCAGITGTLIWLSFHEILWVLMGVGGVIFVPLLWLNKQRHKRLDQFEAQLPEALQMMSRALRTGYSFLESMNVVAKEMSEPISKEFSLTFDEINYGRDIEVAFAIMIERVPSMSLLAMSTAIVIQKETGGNLAEVLLKISAVLNARFKLQRRIKTLSAEGVMSAWILIFLPLALFLVINLISPGYFTPLYESPYKMNFIGIFFSLEFIAMIWIRMIINIDA